MSNVHEYGGGGGGLQVKTEGSQRPVVCKQQWKLLPCMNLLPLDNSKTRSSQESYQETFSPGHQFEERRQV